MIFNLYGKGDAAYCSVTLKYVNTSGAEIAATTVKMVPIGNTYTVTAAPSLSGYSFSSQSHTTNTVLTINSNIVITYTYLTYYTVTYKYVNTSGTSIKTSTTTSVLEGNTHTIGSAPTISNYNYKSCSHTINGSITVKSNITVTYTYEQAIMYLYNSGDITANTGGWVSMVDGNGTGKDAGTYLNISSGWEATGDKTGIRTANKIDFSQFSKIYIYFDSIQYASGGSANSGFQNNTCWGTSSSASFSNPIKVSSLNGTSWPTGTSESACYVTNVQTSYNISSLTTKNGYLYFYTVDHLNGAAHTPKMKISKIWLE